MSDTTTYRVDAMYRGHTVNLYKVMVAGVCVGAVAGRRGRAWTAVVGSTPGKRRRLPSKFPDRITAVRAVLASGREE